MEALAGEKREGPQSRAASQSTNTSCCGLGARPRSGQWAPPQLPRSGDPQGVRQGAALLCGAAEAPGGQARELRCGPPGQRVTQAAKPPHRWVWFV